MKENTPEINFEFLFPILQESLEEIDGILKKKLKSGELTPHRAYRYSWKSKNPTGSSFLLHTRQIVSWEHVMLRPFDPKHKIILNVLNKINSKYNRQFKCPGDFEGLLRGFFNMYMEHKLTHKRVSKKWKKKTIENIVAEMQGKLLPYDIKIYIFGVEPAEKIFTIKVPDIVDIRVRKSVEQDFEIETRFPKQFSYKKTPAIFDLRFYNSWINKYNQGDVALTLAIFKLFSPSGIKEYLTFGETAALYSTSAFSTENDKADRPRFSLRITEENSKSLKNFIRRIITQRFLLFHEALSEGKL